MLAGGTTYFFGPIAVFWVMATMAVASIVATLSMPARTIDHEIARGLTAQQEETHAQPSGFHVLLESRPLLIFAACVTMFHFANAAMLPLVGQKLALADRDIGTALMSACIVAAQVVMVPMAMLVGAKADSWGRKPLFLAGFAVPGRSAGRSIRFPMTPIGCSACNFWTALARAFLVHSFRSLSPISHAAPAVLM